MIKWAISLALLLASGTIASAGGKANLASSYSEKGGITASGEAFSPAKLIAAHRTLPFGTFVRITNLNNGRAVVVRINDRGPFVKNRIIDLPQAAAQKLRFSRLVPVSLEAVGAPAPFQFSSRGFAEVSLG
jgi:rare lipoprotein A